MSPRRQERTLRHLAEVADLLPDVREQYQWAAGMAHSKVASHDPEVQIARTEASNPTEQIATDPRSRRITSAVRQAEKDIANARNLLLGSLRVLLRSFPRDDGEHVPAAYHDPAPRLVTSIELDEAHAAKRRRQSRGEDFGDG